MLSLVLFFSVLVTVRGTRIAKNCELSGKSYNDGQQFDYGCQQKCTCKNGIVACVPGCQQETKPAGKCAKVRQIGDCCGRYVCNEELVNDRCETEVKSDGSKAPWIVRFVAKVGELERHSAATIVGSKNLMTSHGVLNETLSFTYPTAAGAWVVAEVFQPPLITGTSYWDIVLNFPMDYTTEMHPINAPANHGSFCDVGDCVLYLISFDVLTNETYHIPAKRVESNLCGIAEGDSTQYFCVQPDYDKKPNCTNFDGSPVMVRKQKSFYMIGILTGPFTYDNQCDSVWPDYRIFLRTCYSSAED